MVASGLLQAGEEISPVRSLALQLNVTPNTVVKAYDELEAAGVLFKRRGAGTYISDQESPLAEKERTRIIEARIDTLLAEAHQLDFTPASVLAMLEKRQAALAESEEDSRQASKKNGDQQ